METSKALIVKKEEEGLNASGTPLGLLDNGNPWWDISSVRLGLKPAELNRELIQIRDHLRSLILYGDRLDVRRHPASLPRRAFHNLIDKWFSESGEQPMKGGEGD